MNLTHNEDRALQNHIRNILYDYALQHLTYNYFAFTEEAVTEVCGQITTIGLVWTFCIDTVAMSTPGSLVRFVLFETT